MVHIKNGKVFIKINGEFKETTNPELIGFAVLDVAELADRQKNEIDLVRTINDEKLILKE